MSREIKFQFLYKGLPFSSTDEVCNWFKKVYTLGQLIDTPLQKLSDVHNQAELIAKRQFTGLQDINGVDIYEGDIISSNFYGDNVDWDDVAEISYCSKKAKYVFNKEEGEQDAFVEGVECGCLKVIGNIHQNKDLIK